MYPLRYLVFSQTCGLAAEAGAIQRSTLGQVFALSVYAGDACAAAASSSDTSPPLRHAASSLGLLSAGPSAHSATHLRAIFFASSIQLDL